MAIDPDLLALYRATLYEVDWERGAFVLRIDEPSARLADCHRGFGVSCSCFITAWNPRSRPASDAVNAAAQARLQEFLRDGGYRTLQGRGRDPSGRWSAEPSLLVPGMNADRGAARGTGIRPECGGGGGCRRRAAIAVDRFGRLTRIRYCITVSPTDPVRPSALPPWTCGSPREPASRCAAVGGDSRSPSR